MGSLVNKWIIIFSKEDLGIFKYLFPVLVFLFSLVMNYIQGYSILLLYISIISYQFATMHRRFNVSDFLYSTAINNNKIVLGQYIVSFICNIYMLFFLCLYLFFKLKINIELIILFSIICFLFANVFGILMGLIFKNYILGFIIMSVFYFYNMNDSWTSQEIIRYISVTLQVFNLNSINISNIWGLINFIFLFIGLSCMINKQNLKKNLLSFLSYFLIIFLSFITLIGYDLNFNKRIENMNYTHLDIDGYSVDYRGISSKEAYRYGAINSFINNELNQMNIPINIKPSVITMYQQMIFTKYRMIPVKVIDNKYIQINFFSQAMRNASINDYFLRVITNSFPNDKKNDIQLEILETLKNFIHFRLGVVNPNNVMSKDNIETSQIIYNNFKDNAKVENNFISELTIYILENNIDFIDEFYNFMIIENTPDTYKIAYKLLNKEYFDFMQSEHINQIWKGIENE